MITGRPLLLGALLFSIAALQACEEKGPAERAGERVDEAVDDAGRSMDRAGDRARDAAD